MSRKKHYTKGASIDSAIIGIITSTFDAVTTLVFYCLYGSYLLIKSIVTRRSIEKHSLKQRKAFKRTFVGISLITGLIALFAYLINPVIVVPFAFIGSIIVLVLLLKYLLRWHKRKLVTGGIDKYLRRALELMDTTSKWYNDENTANQELVSCLKAQHIDATYQCRLSSGRTVDAKVGDILIEGKLSPDTAEVDRLLGQLSSYMQHSNMVNVVIYGKLDKEARERIEDEITGRYVNKVFLTYLDNPHRLRVQ